MPADNLSAMLYKKGDLRLENRPIPEPKDDEVQVQVGAVGICGTDVHYWVRGVGGDFVVKDPIVLGHEAAGVVSKLGKNVTHLKVGDRVALEPGIPCRQCDYCKGGRYNLCSDSRSTPKTGMMSRYFNHAADYCFKLPDNVSLEEGAFLEPLSVGIHACRRVGVTLGSRVLISGAGAIGLVNLLVARVLGASTIIVTDIAESRLALAKELGADHTVLVNPSLTPQENAKEIQKIMGKLPDITLECCGVQSSVQFSVFATRSGGKVALVGLGPEYLEFPIISAATREVDVFGIYRYVNTWPLAIEMVATGQVPIKKLITHKFKLEDTYEALETSRTGTGGAIKVIVNC